VAASLFSVWLTIKRRIACWPVGLVGVAAYFGLFFWKGLYLSAALYALFLAMAGAGLRRWLQERRAQAAMHELVHEVATA